jgi:tetratricopeptide (TPR) repeat protein
MIEMSKIRALEGDLKGAIAALESAALCAAGNPLPLLGLSDLARQSQRPDLALEHLHRAKRECRREIWVDLGLAQTLFELGRYAESDEVLVAAQSAYPGHYLVAQVQAELLARRGRVNNAVALVERALTTYPDVESLMLLAAELYQRAGQAGKASQLAAALTPRLWRDNRTRLLQLVAKLAEDDWRREDARKLFVELEQWQPDSRPALEGQIRLALLCGDTGLAHEKLLKFARLEMPGRQARGLSANISQSFWGQYYEEYVLSPDAVTQLGEIDRLPPALRLAPLMALVREMPDWTPASCALLLALREAGLFADEGRGKGGAPAIPRLIFQYWHASEPPADIAGLMASWRELNPDWRYERFDDAGAKTWLAARDQRTLRAYLAARSAAQKSDVLRLALLYHLGGWYADADDCARTPLAAYSTQGVEFVAYQEEFATLGNNILAARPGHPIIGAALQGVVNALLRGDSDIVWLSTGPGMLSRAFTYTLATLGDNWPKSLETVLIMSKPALNRLATPHCHAGYKLAGQHWTDDQFQKAKLAGKEKPAQATAPASKTSG